MSKHRPLSDLLRDAINDCAVSRYRISKDTGIPQSQLSNFVNGKVSLSLDTIDILWKYLGLELATQIKRKKSNG